MREFLRLFSMGALALFISSCHSSVTTVDNQGVEIAYTQAGTGDTALVFVHGWCLNRSYWSNQVDHFKNRYKVVAIDLPGFGESGTNRTDWTTDAFAGDVDAVLTKLDLKHAVLIGHSMSGDIVLQAALHAPDRVVAIVGVDNFKNIHPETDQQKADDARFITLLKRTFTQAAFQLFRDDLFYTTTPDSVKKRILTDVANSDSTIATAVWAQPLYDETGNLVKYGKKLYLVNSDYMVTDTAAFTAAHIPYQIFYIPDCGHFPMVEKPAQFNAKLEDLLASIGH